MPNVVLRKPIVTPVDIRLSELITNEATPSDEKRELLEDILKVVYQGQESKPDGEDKEILLYALEDISKRYEESRNRKSGALYVNHPISAARVAALTGDTMAVLAALYHDTAEEYIEGEHRKFISEQTDSVSKRINSLYESKAKEAFSRSWSLLKERQRKVIRKSIKQDISSIREQAEKAKKRFLSQEPELIKEYLTNLEQNFSTGLILRGIGEDRAKEISKELTSTVSALTRNVDDNYYKAVDKIISPRDELSPQTKFRGVLTKFSDCLVNTEIVDDKVYSLKELAEAVRSNNTEAIREFARLTEKANKRHKKEDKTGRVLGHKRVYRIFKNYFLINSFRTYKHHMHISNVFHQLVTQGLLDRAMVGSGLLEDMVKLTDNYYMHKNIAGVQEGNLFRALETLRMFSGEVDAQYMLSEPEERRNFVHRCVKSGYFRYIKTVEELGVLIERYTREADEFMKVKDTLELLEEALIKRNKDCAKAILDHLVSYHPTVTPQKVVDILERNRSYIHAKGYDFVTMPSDSTVQIEKDEELGELRVHLVNGTRKSLETPDGLIVMFIDAKVKGEDTRLDELYSNKINMFWAALAAKTLGYSYKHNSDFVLTGLDTKGAHPTRSITK
ncbi:hypothetical protein HY636_00375 [Candidatus Woesearchaeota archaeon]|nr:hypothetical protein [Candidatus Woesearchaeota archaeon]